MKGKYDFNKTTNSRVHPRAIEKVREILDKKPTEIQRICNESNLNNPINLKSIYNQKSMAKQRRDEKPDEQHLGSNIITDSFIQSKTLAYDKDDVYILFDNDQLEDMKFHCLYANVNFFDILAYGFFINKK